MFAESVAFSISLSPRLLVDHQVYGAGALWAFRLLHYYRKCEIKTTGLKLFLVLMGHTY